MQYIQAALTKYRTCGLTRMFRSFADHVYPYAVSIKDYSDSKKDYTVKHYKIRTTNNGGWYISHTQVFRSIAQLVEFYSGEKPSQNLTDEG